MCVVCVHVYVCACVCLCVCVCVCVCVLCIYVHDVYVHVCVRAWCVYVCVLVRVCKYICMCIFVCMCTHTVQLVAIFIIKNRKSRCPYISTLVSCDPSIVGTNVISHPGKPSFHIEVVTCIYVAIINY